MQSENHELLGIEERKEIEDKLKELKMKIENMEGYSEGLGCDWSVSEYDEPTPPWVENDLEQRCLYAEIEELENQLYEDDYKKEYGNLLIKQIYNNSFYFRGNVLNDYLPIKDLLNREVKASEIARQYVMTSTL